jgi:hypothetical protein
MHTLIILPNNLSVILLETVYAAEALARASLDNLIVL